MKPPITEKKVNEKASDADYRNTYFDSVFRSHNLGTGTAAKIHGGYESP
ncbi:MAG: hypothetical protein OXI43_20040 [Candidatus Poribacteria bacterium]|nr:hypothetical protein [Candidatus Poribacteria bacterium]